MDFISRFDVLRTEGRTDRRKDNVKTIDPQNTVCGGIKYIQYVLKVAAIESKQIANMLYHAGVETLLSIGYAEFRRKLLKGLAPKVDFNIGDTGMLSVDILLAMATRDTLIKQGIMPADIMK